MIPLGAAILKGCVTFWVSSTGELHGISPIQKRWGDIPGWHAVTEYVRDRIVTQAVKALGILQNNQMNTLSLAWIQLMSQCWPLSRHISPILIFPPGPAPLNLYPTIITPCGGNKLNVPTYPHFQQSLSRKLGAPWGIIIMSHLQNPK